MPLPCFRCDSDLKATDARCIRCQWDCGTGLSEADDRYVVLLALIYRALREGERAGDFKLRIAASSREMAVLSHGDQCEFDGVKWRITARNQAKNVFYLKGFRIIKFPNHQYFEFEESDPVDEIKREMLRWRNLHSAYYEMWRLKKRGALEAYLKKSPRRKARHRSNIQDESPYLK